MKAAEMRTALQAKDDLLAQRTRRILLLEERMTSWRKKYFRLKHANISEENNEELMLIVSM